MKNVQENDGKISNHSHGMGTVTRDMVEHRAKELAVINGRAAHEFTDNDLQAAKLEMLGIHSASEDGESETIAALTRWDEEPGTSGHRVETSNASDEQSVAERLVQEGVDDAEHDRMLKGSVEGRNQG
ncbi:MAG: hypothetical protein ABI042_16290 [Verrucomicrobiota bacterium]